MARVSQLGPSVAVAGVPVKDSSSRPFLRPEGWEKLRFAVGLAGVPLPASRATSLRPYGVPGACFGIRKLLDLTPFDRRVFLFFEEMILAEKVRRLGRDVAMLEGPVIEHAVGQSRGQSSAHLRKVFLDSQSLYLRDYLNWSNTAVALTRRVSAARLAVGRGV